jgi:hypothetical protein
MSKAVKIKINVLMFKQAVVNESETWAMTEMDKNRLGTWERKILRRIH